MSGRPASPARRRLLAGGLAAALIATASGAAAQGGIIVVSRERILREAEAARRLHEAEAALTKELQGQIDATKAALADEEEELARLRGEMAEAEFEARVADFDRRVRQARRVAQERAGILQEGFQDARAAILAALPQLIERLRVETGASIVIDADQVLAMDGAIDMTDRAIDLFDMHGPSPSLPEIDLSGPLLAPDGTGAAPAPGGGADQPVQAPPPAR
ncbi:MAG TPA: OmpH family outer membrane protein [Paracoccaceae bacterium]|nr:OmpH family outer membrane protein [Paracoccaceae bacterium]